MAAVMIGIDPHKASHTAVAISPAEEPLGQLRVRASCRGARSRQAMGEAAVVAGLGCGPGYRPGDLRARRAYLSATLKPGVSANWRSNDHFASRNACQAREV